MNEDDCLADGQDTKHLIENGKLLLAAGTVDPELFDSVQGKLFSLHGDLDSERDTHNVMTIELNAGR